MSKVTFSVLHALGVSKEIKNYHSTFAQHSHKHQVQIESPSPVSNTNNNKLGTLMDATMR